MHTQCQLSCYYFVVTMVLLIIIKLCISFPLDLDERLFCYNVISTLREDSMLRVEITPMQENVWAPEAEMED